MVDRCVCHDVTLARLLEIARREGLSFAELQARGHCSGGCAMCAPYVRLALRTGRTEFVPLSDGELGRLDVLHGGPADHEKPRP